MSIVYKFISDNEYQSYKLKPFLDKLGPTPINIYNEKYLLSGSSNYTITETYLNYDDGHTMDINGNYFRTQSSVYKLTPTDKTILSDFKPYTYVDFGILSKTSNVVNLPYTFINTNSGRTLIYEVHDDYMLIEKPREDNTILGISSCTYDIINVSKLQDISDILFDVYLNYEHLYYYQYPDNIRTRICSQYALILKENEFVRNISSGLIYQKDDLFNLDIFNINIDSEFNHLDDVNLIYKPIELIDIGIDKKTKLPIPLDTNNIDLTVVENLWYSATTYSVYVPTPPTPAFIFKLNITAPNTVITMPHVVGPAFIHNYSIDWGNGTIKNVTSYNDPNTINTYAVPGVYTVTIIGTCETFYTMPGTNSIVSYLTNVISWGATGNFKMLNFYGCTKLSTLPNESGKLTNIVDFGYAFFNCQLLTSIPTGIFDNNTASIRFDSTFFNCLLLTSIPNGLFKDNFSVTSFRGTFYNCSSITTIPSGLFDNNPLVTTFQNIFYICTSLTTIPSGLFDNNTLVNTFSYTFYNCSGLTSIPTGLFDNNTLVTDFSYTFFHCYNLTSIPTGLFNNNTLVTDFSHTFWNCFNLSGSAPELWLRSPQPIGTQCFSSDVNLSNYTSIPLNWK